ncbi:hypothetical protein SDC9_142316 [bioreactor metagenome]|uniref:Uncharacterized protein n=1 Tax=bioreactor metagenome TaxID=1076179 RepID=A0A645E0S7_9ZZZZ
MQEDGIQELLRLVAGALVLVEEAEDVHLAEGQLQRFPRVRLEAEQRQGNGRLIPGLAEDGYRIVRAGAGGAEGKGVRGVGEQPKIREGGVETEALAHAQVGEQLVFDVADRLER